jgi:hypothetical protein
MEIIDYRYKSISAIFAVIEYIMSIILVVIAGFTAYQIVVPQHFIKFARNLMKWKNRKGSNISGKNAGIHLGPFSLAAFGNSVKISS